MPEKRCAASDDMLQPKASKQEASGRSVKVEGIVVKLAGHSGSSGACTAVELVSSSSEADEDLPDTALVMPLQSTLAESGEACPSRSGGSTQMVADVGASRVKQECLSGVGSMPAAISLPERGGEDAPSGDAMTIPSDRCPGEGSLQAMPQHGSAAVVNSGHFSTSGRDPSDCNVQVDHTAAKSEREEENSQSGLCVAPEVIISDSEHAEDVHDVVPTSPSVSVSVELEDVAQGTGEGAMETDAGANAVGVGTEQQRACARQSEPVVAPCSAKCDDQVAADGKTVDSHGQEPDDMSSARLALQAFEDDRALFEQHVQELLQSYLSCSRARKFNPCFEFLERLPPFAPSLGSLSSQVELRCMQNAFHTLRLQTVNGNAATEVAVPTWLCHPWPVCVLAEAWARCSTVPQVFFVDCLLSCFTAILHKDISVDACGFKIRPRYWTAATGDPGAGKSPGLDPMRAELEAALREHDAGPGVASENWHVQQGTTHAAAFSRYLDTKGYLFIASAEAGPLLCPSFATSGRWDRGNFIDYSRFLDAAYGGPIRWETMEHRKQKRSSKSNKDEAQETSTSPSAIHSSNVQICMLQQIVIFSKWWAQMESNEPVGLAPRFLLSFGAAGTPGDFKLNGFARDVARPFLKSLFATTLRVLGPSCPFAEELPRSVWHLDETMEKFLMEARKVASYVANDPTHGTLLRSAMNKATYWIASVALQGTLLSSVVAPAAKAARGGGGRLDADQILPTRQVLETALVAGVRFFWQRYAFGVAVLQRDIRERSWLTIDKPLNLQVFRSDRHNISRMLRMSSGLTITLSDAMKANDSLLSNMPRDSHMLVLRRQFETMRGWGLGRDVEDGQDIQSLCFHKTTAESLAEPALKVLRELRVPLISFGAAVLYRESITESGGHCDVSATTPAQQDAATPTTMSTRERTTQGIAAASTLCTGNLGQAQQVAVHPIQTEVSGERHQARPGDNDQQQACSHRQQSIPSQSESAQQQQVHFAQLQPQLEQMQRSVQPDGQELHEQPCEGDVLGQCQNPTASGSKARHPRGNKRPLHDWEVVHTVQMPVASLQDITPALKAMIAGFSQYPCHVKKDPRSLKKETWRGTCAIPGCAAKYMVHLLEDVPAPGDITAKVSQLGEHCHDAKAARWKDISVGGLQEAVDEYVKTCLPAKPALAPMRLHLTAMGFAAQSIPKKCCTTLLGARC